MRAWLLVALLPLAACVAELGDPCEKDDNCASNLCIATRTPADDGAAVDVRFCAKGCTVDTDCKDVSSDAKCQAAVTGKLFCAELVTP